MWRCRELNPGLEWVTSPVSMHSAFGISHIHRKSAKDGSADLQELQLKSEEALGPTLDGLTPLDSYRVSEERWLRLLRESIRK